MIFIVKSWQTGICFYTCQELPDNSHAEYRFTWHLAAQITAFPTAQLAEHSEHLGFRGASEPKRLSELGHGAGSRGRQGSWQD